MQSVGEDEESGRPSLPSVGSSVVVKAAPADAGPKISNHHHPGGGSHSHNGAAGTTTTLATATATSGSSQTTTAATVPGPSLAASGGQKPRPRLEIDAAGAAEEVRARERLRENGTRMKETSAAVAAGAAPPTLRAISATRQPSAGEMEGGNNNNAGGRPIEIEMQPTVTTITRAQQQQQQLQPSQQQQQPPQQQQQQQQQIIPPGVASPPQLHHQKSNVSNAARGVGNNNNNNSGPPRDTPSNVINNISTNNLLGIGNNNNTTNRDDSTASGGNSAGGGGASLAQEALSPAGIASRGGTASGGGGGARTLGVMWQTFVQESKRRMKTLTPLDVVLFFFLSGIFFGVHVGEMALTFSRAPPVKFSMALTFGAIWHFPWRIWPALVLGSFGSAIYLGTDMGLDGGVAVAIAIIITIGHILEMILGVALLKFVSQGDATPHGTPSSVSRLVFLIGPAVSTVPSIITALSIHVASPSDDALATLWFEYWLSHTCALLMGGLALWHWAHVLISAFRAVFIDEFVPQLVFKWAVQNFLAIFDAFVCVAAVVGVSSALFLNVDVASALNFSQLTFLTTITALIRLEGRISFLPIMFATLVACIGTRLGIGPFAVNDSGLAMKQLQTYVVSLYALALLLDAKLIILSTVSSSLAEKEQVLEKRNRELTEEVEWRRQAEESIRLEKQKVELTSSANKRIEKSCRMLLSLATSLHPDMTAAEVVKKVLSELRIRYSKLRATYILLDANMRGTVVASTAAFSVPHFDFSRASMELKIILETGAQTINISDMNCTSLLDGVQMQFFEMGIASLLAVPGRHPQGRSLLFLHSPSKRRWRSDIELTLQLFSDFLTVGIAQAYAWHEKTAAEQAAQIARERAELATKAKSDFLARMSHEIRTPIASVIGLVNLLKDTSLTEEQDECLESIALCSNHLLVVINDILDLAKIEANKLELESISMNVYLVIEQAFALVGGKLKDTVELFYTVDDNAPPVIMGDPTRLRQVLINLVGNATKFTENGHIHVHVSVIKRLDCTCGCNTPGHSLLLFAVTDTGIGVPLEAQGKLMQEFSQASAATARLHGGTGLGLTISSHLTRLMGGTHSPPAVDGTRRSLWFESTPGEGSTFFFCVDTPPLNIAPQIWLPVCPLPTPAPQAIMLFRNKAAQEALSSFLLRLNVKARVAPNIKAVRSLLSVGGMGLVVTNVGLEALELWEGPDAITAPGVVILSKKDSFSPKVPKLRHIQVLTKPVCLSALRSKISRLPKVGESYSEPSSTAVVPVSTAPQRPKVNRKVLLAEDDPILQKSMQRMLERIGCRVELAPTGKIAVDLASSSTFDIVFMDCHMPVMDGFDATRAIRMHEKKEAGGGRVAIVALSASTSKEDRDAALTSGMDGFVTKPTTESTLVEAIERYAARNVVDLSHADDAEQFTGSLPAF